MKGNLLTLMNSLVVHSKSVASHATSARARSRSRDPAVLQLMSEILPHFQLIDRLEEDGFPVAFIPAYAREEGGSGGLRNGELAQVRPS